MCLQRIECPAGVEGGGASPQTHCKAFLLKINPERPRPLRPVSSPAVNPLQHQPSCQPLPHLNPPQQQLSLCYTHTKATHAVPTVHIVSSGHHAVVQSATFNRWTCRSSNTFCSAVFTSFQPLSHEGSVLMLPLAAIDLLTHSKVADQDIS